MTSAVDKLIEEVLERETIYKGSKSWTIAKCLKVAVEALPRCKDSSICWTVSTEALEKIEAIAKGIK